MFKSRTGKEVRSTSSTLSTLSFGPGWCLCEQRACPGADDCVRLWKSQLSKFLLRIGQRAQPRGLARAQSEAGREQGKVGRNQPDVEKTHNFTEQSHNHLQFLLTAQICPN